MPKREYFQIHYYKGNNWQLNWGRIAAFNSWDKLSPFQNGLNGRLGRINAFWNLGRIVAWDELSLYTANRHYLIIQS